MDLLVTTDWLAGQLGADDLVAIDATVFLTLGPGGYLAESGRLAAHTLQYAASPAEMNAVAKYGYWGPYCSNATTGGFYMCHKGHGYGRMHGPHVMEEWFVSGASQAGPEEPPKFYP